MTKQEKLLILFNLLAELEYYLPGLRLVVFSDESGHFTTSEDKLVNDIDFNSFTNGIDECKQLLQQYRDK